MKIELTPTQVNYVCTILAEKDTDEADAVLMQICSERIKIRNEQIKANMKADSEIRNYLKEAMVDANTSDAPKAYLANSCVLC